MNARGLFCLSIAFVFILSGCGKLGAILSPVSKKKETVELTLKAKVRDFKEGNATDKSGTHPHFNQANWTCDPKTAGAFSVAENLDLNQSSDAGFPGDNRGPALLQPLAAGLARCFDPPDRFGDWYQDKGAEVNRPFIVDITFTQDDATKYYSYNNMKFFPIDNGGNYAKEKSDGPDTFGHLQTGTKDEVDLTQHNYGFTLEMHAKFTYHHGAGQFFAALADDDFWLFINDKRAIDLGGSHPALRDTVYLDDHEGELGLVDQTEYPADFFFAERAIASSKLAITTNAGLSAQ
jgi:fibro-slime domain-containing protein